MSSPKPVRDSVEDLEGDDDVIVAAAGAGGGTEPTRSDARDPLWKHPRQAQLCLQPLIATVSLSSVDDKSDKSSHVSPRSYATTLQ